MTFALWLFVLGVVLIVGAAMVYHHGKISDVTFERFAHYGMLCILAAWVICLGVFLFWN